MAQLIHAEGRGEPLEGQVAIGVICSTACGQPLSQFSGRRNLRTWCLLYGPRWLN